MKKKISLKWKIARYLILFATILIALIWVFQIALLQPMYQQYKVSTVKNAANEIVDNLDSDRLTSIIYSVSAQNDTCVRIINASSDVQSGNMGCVLYRMNSKEILQQVALAEENSGSYLYTSSGNDIAMPGNEGFKNIMYTRIVDTAGGRNIVMVYSGVSPVNATTKTLSSQLVWITLFVVVAIVLLTFLMNKTISKPLTEITDKARELPRGEFEYNSKNEQYEEAQLLNETLTQAAADIKKADQAKRDLIANVSHDLRTPLTMISGYGEMMRDLPGEKTDENIQVIIDESNRLTALVNDLLDLSKMQSAKIALKQTDFNLSDMIENQMKKYDVYRIQEHYVFESDVPSDIMVHGDDQRIEQVLNNFITNAINYGGSAKHMIIRCKLINEKARIEVQDFGEGIPADKINDIWDRYYKIDKKHVRVSNGSGIGLAIVKQILDLHHAAYGVESKVGHGSTFWFELPLSCTVQKEKSSADE
ncbi:MAG: HAMP domain-containing histidine kinase [Erysipelotrichia bacterium]|nr:HAMP domain-containing histidine kinase [Erysipelotrichia bacterium]